MYTLIITTWTINLKSFEIKAIDAKEKGGDEYEL